MVSEDKLICTPNGLNPFTIAPPSPLQIEHDKLANNWRLWRQSYDDFLTLTNFRAESKQRQLAMFRYAVGEDARAIINSLSFKPTEDHTDPLTVMDKFEQYCLQHVNETFELFQFFERNQFPEETIENFTLSVKELANSCNFCDCMKDSLIRDRIIYGIRDKSLTKQLLSNRDLSLEQCIAICRMEASLKSRMQSLDSGTLHATQNMVEWKTSVSCTYCGTNHPHFRDRCPAWGKSCFKCGKRNHFACKCRSTIVRQVDVQPKELSINAVQEDRSSISYQTESTKKEEPSVKNIELLKTKAQDISEDTLLEQWNTLPHTHRLNRRSCHTLSPSISRVPKHSEVLDRLQERSADELQPGEEVWVKYVPEQPNQWGKGIIRQCYGWRAYDVETDGVIKRRNRIHLRKRRLQTEFKNAVPVAEPSRTNSGCIFKQGRM